MEDETYFVKRGDDIKGYKILDVNKVYVEILKQEDNKKIQLELNKIASEGKISANIYDTVKEKTHIIEEGSKIDGWEVQLISKEHVRLGKGNNLIYVRKGE